MPPAPDYIVARLFLRAVLPALPLYVKGDESARSTIEGWRCAVRLASTSGVGTTLAFRDGAVAVDQSAAGIALRLLFLSDRDVVRTFRREGRPWVLPWGGLHHLGRLRALSGLLADMAEVLNPPTVAATESASGQSTIPGLGNRLPRHSNGCIVEHRNSRVSGNPQPSTKSGDRFPSDRQELRAELLFGALLPAAVVELGVHETQCQRLLAPFGDFVAQISVLCLCDAWVRRHGSDWAWGRGIAPGVPDVRVGFRNSDTALAVVDGTIDSLAATVTGDISVRGMIPLADVLAQVMEQVSECLGQGRS